MKGYDLAKPWLFRLDAESVHERAIALLHRISLSSRACTALARAYGFHDDRLKVRLFDREFDNPFGVAAGLDKNAAAIPALHALGFGFVEVGTVTPQPQSGNDRPRIFRLEEDWALINRMGFPSAGMYAIEQNLLSMSDRLGRFGLNIGPNKESVAAEVADQDCLTVLIHLRYYPDYVVVNVSSPNTARLRELQGRDALRQLLSRVVDFEKEFRLRKPILVKIAPDLTDRELNDILQVATDLELAGIVATNTTLDRPDYLRNANKGQLGGLSGLPLRDRSLQVVQRIYSQTGSQLPIIAAGGVVTGQDVFRLIAAGASLVQTYTGFIYQGPGMARDIKRTLVDLLDSLRIGSIMEVRGRTDLL